MLNIMINVDKNRISLRYSGILVIQKKRIDYKFYVYETDILYILLLQKSQFIF